MHDSSNGWFPCALCRSKSLPKLIDCMNGFNYSICTREIFWMMMCFESFQVRIATVAIIAYHNLSRCIKSWPERSKLGWLSYALDGSIIPATEGFTFARTANLSLIIGDSFNLELSSWLRITALPCQNQLHAMVILLNVWKLCCVGFIARTQMGNMGPISDIIMWPLRHPSVLGVDPPMSNGHTPDNGTK